MDGCVELESGTDLCCPVAAIPELRNMVRFTPQRCLLSARSASADRRAGNDSAGALTCSSCFYSALHTIALAHRSTELAHCHSKGSQEGPVRPLLALGAQV